MATHLSPTAPQCPLNFSFVGATRWDASNCQGQSPPLVADSPCCMVVVGLFLVALAPYLRISSHFYLPDVATASACLSEFQQSVSRLVPSRLVSACLGQASGLVSNTSLCAGIQTLKQWRSVFPTHRLDTQCAGDLSSPQACGVCRDAMKENLASFSNNTLNCLRFTSIYVIGVVNKFDPITPAMAWCSLGVPVLGHHNHQRMVISVSAGIASTFLLVFIVAGFLLCRRLRLSVYKDIILRYKPMKEPNTGPLWLDYKGLQAATDDFSERNLIGRGGFGEVYKGTLPDGHRIAVKRFLDSLAEVGFKNEVEVISTIRHRNLVALRGCCVLVDHDMGPQRLLVYDYYPNGNLETHLFSSASFLTWPQRKHIILGIAHGLAYLHQDVDPAIYHRDVKPTNVLLDGDMNALVADFGLARIGNTDGLTSTVAGTYGYIAPEYALYGHLTDKSDVYGFGVLALVVISGRPALMQHGESSGGDDGQHDMLITDWAWRLLKSGEGMEVVDDRIKESAPKTEVTKFLKVGILCAHAMVAFRPTMNEALRMLEGDIEIPHIPERSLPFQCRSGSDYLSWRSFGST